MAYTGIPNGLIPTVFGSIKLGWRSAFNITGLVGVLYAVPLLLLLRDSPSQIEKRKDPVKTSIPGKLVKLLIDIFRTAKELLTNRNFILLVLYFTLPALAAWVVRDWMPAILQKAFNISQGKAGV